MVYDDPLSKKSLQHDSNWPPRDWLTEPAWQTPHVEAELKRQNFDFEQWLEYKLQVPNDGRERVHSHPRVEYLLTTDELRAYEDDYELCNPSLCPNWWREYSREFGEFMKRFWWLNWQFRWIFFGYPDLPRIIWDSNQYTLLVFNKLVYEPFIQQWSDPPDDFWVKLSYHFEEDNRSRLHRGFVLLFESQGCIFPSPDLYDLIEDPEGDSLFLPIQFWSD